MVSYTQLPNPLATVVTGTSGRDVFSGFTGHDTLYGGAGADYIFEGRAVWSGASVGGLTQGQSYDFGTGNDLIYGGIGSDLLSYSGSTRAGILNLGLGTQTRATTTQGTEIDRFFGVELFLLGDGDDQVMAGLDDVAVATMAGNDTVRGLSGNGTLDGGAGTDLLDLTGETGALTVNLLQKSASFGNHVSGFEAVLGATNAANILTGAGTGEWLAGGNLADEVNGGAGNDRLFGDAGQDRLIGGLGADMLFGGDDGDYLRIESLGDNAFGGAGNDTLTSGIYAVVDFHGDLGDDSLRISNGQAHGDDGNDTIVVAQKGVVAAFGDSGDDLFATIGTVFTELVFYGGDGRDTYQFALGKTPVTPSFFGGAGDDAVDILGLYGGDKLVAHFGDGNDSLSSSRGLEILGGTVYGEAGDDTLAGLYRAIVYGGDDDDVLSGNGGTLHGDAGNDFITISRPTAVYGGDGDDRVLVNELDFTVDFARAAQFDMVGGAGNDTIEIGSGIIALYADGTTEGVTDYDVIGFETIILTGTNIRVLDYAGLGADTIFGAAADWVEGHVAGEVYHLGGAADHGTAYADDVTIFGETQDDSLGVGTGRRAFLYGGQGNDTFTTKLDALAYGEIGNDRFLAAGRSAVYGGAGNDTLVSAFGVAILDGGIGNDTFDLALANGRGAGGDIDVFGGIGADNVTVRHTDSTIDLGSGDDQVTFIKSLNWQWVPTTVMSTLTTGTGSDVIWLNDWDAAGVVTITDFDIGADRLAAGVTHLADFDQINDSADGVTLTRAGFSVTLVGLTAADLTDLILM